MDFLSGKIKTIYFKYLSAAFGSALITSIYSIVDMAMVGQYHGPEGSAALAVVAPVWNIIYSFGLLMGIGGSVLFSTIRGKADGDIGKSNEYFTASVIGSVVLAAIIWLIIILFDKELLLVFGAQDNTLTLAREYVLPIKLEESRRFLNEEWIGKKKAGIYKNTVFNLDLVEAYQQQNAERYNELYGRAGRSFKKNRLFGVQKLFLEHQYKQAIDVLEGYKVKTVYNNVIRSQLLGLCYDNLGDRKRAEECMRYVLEHGNTMPARAKAEEWLAHDSEQSESK